MARYTARLLTIPSLRIFTRMASKNTMASVATRPRLSQAATSSSTESVTALTRSGEISVPYSSPMCPVISRVVMPSAYNPMTLSSNPMKPAGIANQHRVEPPVPIARNRKLRPAGVGDHGLAVTVAVTASVLLRARPQMVVHLGVEHSLGHPPEVQASAMIFSSNTSSSAPCGIEVIPQGDTECLKLLSALTEQNNLLCGQSVPPRV
jgi:hypothetical protein